MHVTVVTAKQNNQSKDSLQFVKNTLSITDFKSLKLTSTEQ